MSKPRKKSKKILFILEIVVLLLFIGGLFVYGQISAKLDKIDIQETDLADQDIVTNDQAPQMTGYTTYALFGLDHRSKNEKLNTENSDTIIIASINNDTKAVKLVSVYRDTLLNVKDDTYSKANSAYALGGPTNAVSMLNTNLDLNVTDFVSVDFQAVAEAVELLGGIDVELKEEEKMLQMEETSGTEGQGAVSKPVTGTDQIITLDRLAASVYENDNETDDLNWHELQNSMLKQKILTGMLISMERHSIGEGKTVNVALADYQGYRVMIPVTEMNIILSEQDEGDMTKKIRITSNMIGCEIDFIVLKLDTATHSVVASRKKAMEKKVQNFYRPQVEGEAPLIQGVLWKRESWRLQNICSVWSALAWSVFQECLS